MKHSTLCLVDTEDQAATIVEKLRSAGFSDNDISVLFPDKGSTRDFAHKKATKMPEGATVGASTGGAVGGTIGLLAGIGALAIPGLGPFIAAGPIMAALSGGAIGAGVGGLAGALVGLGIPEYEAKRYEGKVKEGGILISVHSENGDETNRAKSIFKEANAHDISTTGEAHSDVKAQDVSDAGDATGHEVSARNDIPETEIPSDATIGIAGQPDQAQPTVSETSAGTQPRARGDEIAAEVPLSEEEIKVGKRTVGAGEVSLQKKVSTEPINVPVELKREDVVIERVPSHEAKSAGKEPFQEERVEVPLSREEPVVEKETRVTGGVRVRKTEGTERETIQETIRREDVDIDEKR
ncbi:MAG TPA: YsnF/AvaK domain-containing protein [Chthoniobacterales bacterium]